MKRLGLAAILVLASSVVYATSAVWRSSNTATADTAQALCTQANRSRHGILHGVCVNTGAAGTLTVYNSSNTAINPVAAINTAAVVPCALYDVAMSSGLTYSNSATANVTILYDCF